MEVQVSSIALRVFSVRPKQTDENTSAKKNSCTPFIGTTEIRLFSLSNLRALLRTPSPTPPTPIAKLTLPPNSRPVWIRFAMGDKKIVVGWVQNGGQDVEEGMGTVGVWSLKKVLEGDVSTEVCAERASSASGPVQADLRSIALLFLDGVLSRSYTHTSLRSELLAALHTARTSLPPTLNRPSPKSIVTRRVAAFSFSCWKERVGGVEFEGWRGRCGGKDGRGLECW